MDLIKAKQRKMVTSTIANYSFEIDHYRNFSLFAFQDHGQLKVFKF